MIDPDICDEYGILAADYEWRAMKLYDAQEYEFVEPEIMSIDGESMRIDMVQRLADLKKSNNRIEQLQKVHGMLKERFRRNVARVQGTMEKSIEMMQNQYELNKITATETIWKTVLANPAQSCVVSNMRSC